jgi:hypothetical protein
LLNEKRAKHALEKKNQQKGPTSRLSSLSHNLPR